MNGLRVDQIKKGLNSSGNRVVSIQWNGCSENGRKMQGAMYIYRIIVTSINGVATATQKLILL